jgi:hypothetical protein
LNVKLKVEISLSKFSPAAKNVVSSAKSLAMTLLIKKGILFMKMRNNNGPKTLSCGTPNSKAIRSDKQSPTLVLRNLSEK